MVDELLIAASSLGLTFVNSKTKEFPFSEIVAVPLDKSALISSIPSSGFSIFKT